MFHFVFQAAKARPVSALPPALARTVRRRNPARPAPSKNKPGVFKLKIKKKKNNDNNNNG